MTCTEMQKPKVRNIYTNVPEASEADQETRKRLADYKTLLLCRGYVTTRGPRGGISFTHVGIVPEDAPAWQQVNEW